jgi:hypothetical protein
LTNINRNRRDLGGVDVSEFLNSSLFGSRKLGGEVGGAVALVGF